MVRSSILRFGSCIALAWVAICLAERGVGAGD